MKQAIPVIDYLHLGLKLFGTKDKTEWRFKCAACGVSILGQVCFQRILSRFVMKMEKKSLILLLIIQSFRTFWMK